MPLFLKALDPTVDILGNEQVLKYNADQVNNDANLLLLNAFIATAGIFPSTSLAFASNALKGFQFKHELKSNSVYGDFSFKTYDKFGSSTDIFKYDELTDSLNFFKSVNLSGLTLSGNLSLNGSKITNIANGTANTDGINLGQLNSAITGLGFSSLSNGLLARTASNTYVSRNIAVGTGLGITNSDGVAGNPTLSLSTQLQNLNNLNTLGFISLSATGTGTSSFINRTLTAGSGISLSNGNGVSGNPTISVANIPINSLASYPSNSSVFLRGDGLWQTPYINSLNINGNLGLGTYNLSTSGTVIGGIGEFNTIRAPGVGFLNVYSPIDMSNLPITDLGSPSNDYDATTKIYVDNKVFNINTNTSGSLNINRLQNYPSNSSLYLRGDGTWNSPISLPFNLYSSALNNTDFRLYNNNSSATATGFSVYNQNTGYGIEFGFNNSTNEAYVFASGTALIKFGTNGTTRARILNSGTFDLLSNDLTTTGNVSATTGTLKGNNLAVHNSSSIGVLNSLNMNSNYINFLAYPLNTQDAATKQYVLDNTGGSAQSILHGYVNSGYSDAINVGDHFKFNGIAFVRGSNISLDTSSSYTTSTGVASIGRITLVAGKTYKLTASLNNVVSANYNATRWYNADNGSVLGLTCGAPSPISTTDRVPSTGTVAYITTSVSTRVELRITWNSFTQIKGTEDSIGPAWFTVEEV